ncbi:glycosyltransferase family 61 protein [Kordiimonas sp.]|uniref:glycosyltransferase family 61 protein n=1 Tax=Kordiimonas sp. TaxID=1970157 RepID=UPI003A91B2CB
MLENLEHIRNYFSNYVKLIKFKLRYKKLNKISIKDITDSVILMTDNGESVSASPKYINQRQHILRYHMVDIQLYHLENVFCNINSSSFVTQDIKRIFIEEFPYISCKQANYSSGFLFKHNSENGYIKNIKIDEAKIIKNALFLGGNGSFNFYHWMIEIAPKLLLLDNSLLKTKKINKILINECVIKNDNYNQILNKYAKHLTDIDFIFINQNKIAFVEKLYFVNTFNQTVYNYKEIPKNYQVMTIYNQIILERMKICLSNSISTGQFEAHEKIFILRNEDTVSEYNNRKYNQSEVFSFFKNQGFIGVYPDKLTIDEQISMFKFANFIVGPSGASWSNLIFCTKDTKAISWIPESLEYFDTYSSLAYLENIDMRFIKYEVEGNNIHQPYDIEVNSLITLYKNMTEVF